MRGLLHSAILLLTVIAATASMAAPNPQVLVKTDMGDFTVELYQDKAPVTVDNFLGYARKYFYDGLIFHRVVQDFVIQTGGYTFDLFKKETGEPIINESGNGLRNLRGTLGMARHANPDSATAQFYINLRDNDNLDPRRGQPGYTVFGRVISGMEVVEAIGDLEIEALDELTHLPLEPVRILSVREISSQ